MFLALEAYTLLLPLALIMVLSKLLSIGCRKIGLPQVIGLLLTGVILGLFTLIDPIKDEMYNDNIKEGIAFIAEIGVVLIMFSAGMETDLRQIKKTGVSSVVVTIMGVVVPMALGFGVACLCNGVSGDVTFKNAAGQEIVVSKALSNLFYGTVLTATSVSVTIAALKELGKLNTKIGTIIVSAAILDDIIGVVVLSVILSLGGTSGDADTLGSLMTGGKDSLMLVALVADVILFFIFAIGLGLLLRMLFKKLANKYDHHRRMTIFAVAVAFGYAYLSERLFGVADITGAFFAGLILSSFKDTHYIEKKTEVSSYLIFTPVFFAKVGLNSISSFSSIDTSMILFGILFILAGILGKVVGCGLGAVATKNTFKDGLRCGVGMMCRAEVCLICAQKGIDAGIIDASIQPFILVLILVTSFVTPVILKQTYKKEMLAPIDGVVDETIMGDLNYQGPSIDQ